MSENSKFVCVSQGFIDLLIDIYKSRLPVKDMGLELHQGYARVWARVPMFGVKLSTKLFPQAVSWGHKKELGLRFQDESPISLVVTAVRFIKRGVRVEGDILWVDITQFWEKLPAEMRWNTRLTSVEITEGQLRAHIDRDLFYLLNLRLIARRSRVMTTAPESPSTTVKNVVQPVVPLGNNEPVPGIRDFRL